MSPRTKDYGAIEGGSSPRSPPLEVQPDEDDGDNNGDAAASLLNNNNKNKTFPTTAAAQSSHRKKRNSLLVLGAVVALLATSAVVVRYDVLSGDGSSDGGENGGKTTPASKSSTGTTPALSTASPEGHLLGLHGVNRAEGSDPSPVWGDVEGPYPTNSWYLNLVSHKASVQPDDSTRAYTVPYIIDTAAAAMGNAMAGIRVHWPVVQASDRNIQMVDDFKNGVTLGTSDASLVDEDGNAPYFVDEEEELSPLGVSLKWGDKDNKSGKKGMVTHIVRGMPYATMRYRGGVLPSLYSYNSPASPPLADGTTTMECGTIGGKAGRSVKVEGEVQLHFRNSDFTWALFFSRPVRVSCAVSEGDVKLADFRLDVTGYDGGDGENENDDDEPLTARLALLDQCTTGKSDITQHCVEKAELADHEGYVQLLRERANVFPSSPRIDFAYPDDKSWYDDDFSDYEEEGGREVKMLIDWEARAATDEDENLLCGTDGLIMFALPHHQHDLKSSLTEHCIPTFHGKTCLVEGSTWSLTEDVGDGSAPVSFTARRPPEAEAIPALAEAIAEDIHYYPSDNMLRAAADTYFSGKILARIGRVVTIASELKALAEGSPETLKDLYDDVDDDALAASVEAAAAETLPSDQEITDAIDQLRSGVEVWLSEKAEALYVYDRSWGGLVNCGCKYSTKDSHGKCKNKFPSCPALEDVNQDFGNGFYNDHHFHYGYHIYAAAVVAKYDPEWGRKMFDRVLLYVRDIANPSTDDEYFTQFRQKDWFLGSSWAAGIVSAENSPHGRNQESSSEAVAAYEGVALYGATMVDAFGGSSSETSDGDSLEVAKLVRDAGRLLLSTEVRAANRYWHVWSSDDHVNTYPAAYTQPVVGMLYQTMASFQTWFAPDAVVSYGIQLIPLTPIAEVRDDPVWATELYPLYEESCETAGDFCVDNGWSILQAGLLATTGKRKQALEQALEIPSDVYATDGGIGNSLSNTIWYIATRKPIN